MLELLGVDKPSIDKIETYLDWKKIRGYKQ
jgi:hypothetical protein